MIIINETEKKRCEKKKTLIFPRKKIPETKIETLRMLLEERKERTESNFLKAPIQFDKAANGIALNEHG